MASSRKKTTHREKNAPTEELSARAAHIIDAIAEGIYEWRIETGALWVSDRLCEIFGFELGSLTSEDWTNRFHP